MIWPAEPDEPAPLPPAAQVRFMARELQTLAARAVEFSGTGPTADPQAALRQFERMRAILGPGSAPAGDSKRQ
ncbi:MAG: hypothetical protein ACOY7T_12360 [Pseudomonadota bacterium]